MTNSLAAQIQVAQIVRRVTQRETTEKQRRERKGLYKSLGFRLNLRNPKRVKTCVFCSQKS